MIFQVVLPLCKVKDVNVSENNGIPKIDGENKGKPYLKWDDLGGVFPLLKRKHPYKGHMIIIQNINDFGLPNTLGICSEKSSPTSKGVEPNIQRPNP